MQVTTDFESNYSVFKATHTELIASIADAIDAKGVSETFSEFHYDLASNLKGILGAQAANASSDVADEQEEAISSAEQWVTDNISNGADTKDTVALALWLNGLDVGQKTLAEFLPERAPVPQA